MTKTYGFTGSRFEPGQSQVDRLRERLDGTCADGGTFVTGGCMGMDAIVGSHCARRWPERHHVVIVPTDRKQVDWWWVTNEFVLLMVTGHLEVVFMPPGTTYKDRNQAIVDRSDQLIGLPIGPEDDPRQRRSGTWQTIRMARHAHSQPPILLPLWDL